jgi:aspartate ammonia-lyase
VDTDQIGPLMGLLRGGALPRGADTPVSRMEHDLLGDREVAGGVYYGIQTLRALENYQVTDIPLSHFPNFPKALAMVKKAAALANVELGLVPEDVGAAIISACDAIIEGALLDQFVVDMIQGGAGTSTNMNANEVIANLALELLGEPKGNYSRVHPNDHVNRSQSTNDSYPTAIKMAVLLEHRFLQEEMQKLVEAFRAKVRARAQLCCDLLSQLRAVVAHRETSSRTCSRWGARSCRTRSR